jgi:molybdopterin-biosynthesis enzyme MoeA-like protein
LDRENFYALIIGTEILNGRREDKHFNFLKEILNGRGFKFAGSFIIHDDPELIASTIAYIATLPNSVLFSFGGIGSTPDDHTRLAAAKALRDGKLYLNPQFEQLIIERLGERAYPHPIKMAMLPKDATLLPNPVNKMPGFALDRRFFFMPGFPEMSHPMVEYALDNYFHGKEKKEYRYTLTALCRENNFIELMQSAPKGVEVSSLPAIYSDGYKTTISIASTDKEKAKQEFEKYKKYLEENEIPYGIGEKQ